VAVSDTFLERAKLNSKPGIPLERVVLGCDLSLFDHYALENNVERTDKEIWIGYIGTLGHSYDIKNTINALRILQNAGHKNLRFIVMGSGPFEEAFRRYANESGIPNEFTGSLPYPRMVGKLVACDVVVNPIVKGSAGSLINKVSDYAASGLPVLNTQECPEYRVLVERYRCGLNCKCEDPSDMAAKLNVLLNDPALRKKMGENHRRLAAEVFDRAVSYGRLIEIFRRFRKDAKG
jgi:glycosyltransferase involved in cell wall biosynthesis